MPIPIVVGVFSQWLGANKIRFVEATIIENKDLIQIFEINSLKMNKDDCKYIFIFDIFKGKFYSQVILLMKYFYV